MLGDQIPLSTQELLFCFPFTDAVAPIIWVQSQRDPLRTGSIIPPKSTSIQAEHVLTALTAVEPLAVDLPTSTHSLLKKTLSQLNV